ncbi:MAG: DUF4190 domain-containing protein [Blastocatellia bacterium]
MPISVGIANCSHCGAKVGTLFDETNIAATAARKNPWAQVPRQMDENEKIEKAQNHANSSVILGLSSFFPLFGLALGIAAVVFGTMAVRSLKAHKVEDGLGSATAGFIIGALGIVAQACIIIYALKLISSGSS